MDLFNSMAISSSGLNAQRIVLNVVATNLANVYTTRTEEGGPYLRKQVILSPASISSDFADLLSDKMGRELPGVTAEVVENSEGIKMLYDPTHPDADENGLVAFPNVQIMEEMLNLMKATRSYEANVTAFNSAKHMALKALEIGNK